MGNSRRNVQRNKSFSQKGKPKNSTKSSGSASRAVNLSSSKNDANNNSINADNLNGMSTGNHTGTTDNTNNLSNGQHKTKTATSAQLSSKQSSDTLEHSPQSNENNKSSQTINILSVSHNVDARQNTPRTNISEQPQPRIDKSASCSDTFPTTSSEFGASSTSSTPKLNNLPIRTTGNTNNTNSTPPATANKNNSPTTSTNKDKNKNNSNSSTPSTQTMAAEPGSYMTTAQLRSNNNSQTQLSKQGASNSSSQKIKQLAHINQRNSASASSLSNMTSSSNANSNNPSSPSSNSNQGKKSDTRQNSTFSLPSSLNNSASSSPLFPPSSKRPAYIRQISGINDGIAPSNQQVQSNINNNIFENPGPFSEVHSPVLGTCTPNSMLLDDDAASSINNYGGTSSLLTQLPRKGKLKPKMKSYWAYYIPALEWIPRYKREYLFGDISAGLTLASFQIPVSMSYASSLARVPMVCGLYGLVVGPLIYGLMGTTPYMVVGPEAALSLVIGQSVLPYLHSDTITPAHISGTMAGACGALLLGAGLLRFGFLDSVLSRSLLRGFISAVGLVMIIDQLVPELKLEELLHKTVGSKATTWDKVVFLVQNAHKAHRLTTTVAFTAIIVMIAIRVFKVKISKFYKPIIFVPEILILVILSTMVTDYLDLDKRGLDVVGTIETGHVGFHLPFTHTKWSIFKETFSASFVCAVLGFFESNIAAKSLGATSNVTVSTNRELVALGVTNIVGSMVNALPLFGGYGRSKINMLSGARTHLASFVLALTTTFCIAFAMKYFYYLPKCILSAVISVIGLTLIEEAPRDIMFYWKVSGYEDLLVMCLTLVCTIFWSLEAGIAIGVGVSLVRVVRHSTRSRIQILGRIPGTNTFENADGITPEHLEEIDGCLICKIPEPLFFANTGDLRNRLRRLEVYGSMKVHPSFPRLRHEEMTRSVIFDLQGMTKCDASAMQILVEIVSSYAVDRNIPVFFVRVPESKTVRRLFEASGVENLVTRRASGKHFADIEEALRYIDQQRTKFQNQNSGSANERV